MQRGHHLCNDFFQLHYLWPAHLFHQYSSDCFSKGEKIKASERENMTVISELHRHPTDLMIHKWQRWSSVHSVIVVYQKHCSLLSISPSTSLSAHLVALNGSVCERCRGGMQQTGPESISLGRFKGNFTTYWRHRNSSFEACVSII